MRPQVSLVSASGPEELEIRSEDVSEIARTVAIDRPRRWVFDFERRGSGWSRATRVTCEAVDRVDGCELSIFHEGFQHLPLSLCLSAWEEYRTRWARALERLERDPDALAAATLEQLTHLITRHVRAERFCDGHITAAHASGHLAALIRRLAVIGGVDPDSALDR